MLNKDVIWKLQNLSSNPYMIILHEQMLGCGLNLRNEYYFSYVNCSIKLFPICTFLPNLGGKGGMLPILFSSIFENSPMLSCSILEKSLHSEDNKIAKPIFRKNNFGLSKHLQIILRKAMLINSKACIFLLHSNYKVREL